MGNTINPTKQACENACSGEHERFLTFLTSLGLSDPEEVQELLYHENITSTRNLVYCDSLEQILSKLTLAGDRAKIRGIVAELRLEESKKNPYFTHIESRNYNSNVNTNHIVQWECELKSDEIKISQQSAKVLMSPPLNDSLNSNLEEDPQHINEDKKKETSSDTIIATNLDKNFIFKHSKLNEKISRMNLRRPMILALFDKGSLDHSKVRLIYFTKIIRRKAKPKLLVRILSIDLFVDSKSYKNVLSIEGPLSQSMLIDNYKCKKYFSISNLCINDLIKVAQKTMSNHGEYNLLTNNCRDYSKKLMENVNVCNLGFQKYNRNKHIELVTNGSDCWMLQTYMMEYFDNNFQTNENENENEKDCDENDSDNDKIGGFIQAQQISFESVKEDFHIRNKYNNLKIVKQGYLHQKRGFVGKWQKVWCVLTMNEVLYLFDNDKMIQDPLDSIQIFRRVVERDPKNNKFYIDNATFEAKNKDILKSWVKTIRYCGGKSANNIGKWIVTK